MKKRLIFIWIAIVVLLSLSTLVTISVANNLKPEIMSASSYASTFKEWTVHFPEEMDPHSFTAANVSVVDENGKTIAAAMVWNETNTILTIKAPENGYNANEKYSINISENVQTKNGKHLSNPFSHSFVAVSDLQRIENHEQLLTLMKERTETTDKSFRLFDVQEESSDMSLTTSDSAVGEGSNGFSGTNNQVSGIDEGNTIKTDGEFIYFSRDNDIIIVSSQEPNSQVIGKIEEDNFHTMEIYLKDNLLISLGYSYETLREMEQSSDSDEAEGLDIEIYPPISQNLSARIYDLSDKTKPVKIREVSIEGDLTASRLFGNHLYLIANQYPHYRIMEDSEMDMRPFKKDTAKSESGESVSYEDMYFFPDSSDTNYLILASIDLTDMEKEADIKTYLGASNHVYMSPNHLYLAMNKYNEASSHSTNSTNGSAEIMIAEPMEVDTEIFQFHIDNGNIEYHKSVIVNGSLINQFAMDERNETFRVATTKGGMWNSDVPSTNNLYTYDLDLHPLGSVENLAEGEQIFSVRFMDNVAYMVTFEQIDPLFVIDLEDPEKPTVLGELKIPGFSNYLHPLDENHVIGFGQNTKLIQNGNRTEPQVRTDGLKISLFDVSDPANPVEKDNEIIGRAGSYSELNYNHKVLFKHPDSNLFGFPAVLYETKIVTQGDATYEDQSFVYEGAFLYDITTENGINLYDTISHQPTSQQDYPDFESEIKRIVSIGDSIYTFSNNQYSIYNLDSNSIVKTVDLPPQKHRY
ncbi:beta-propeller domain-containing protein [Oceanobacillus saliphilus]|uniref:beta-propeller domain-containing protein n=1 Tax=Oceanobacillus saliphilus TaxID=2925834 RepID=UPI00201E409B|nr:beta-propeller domain-containing protein [Oceanobacillus saliphilus]